MLRLSLYAWRQKAMAKKGQTCLTCDATCCRLTLSYSYPPMTSDVEYFSWTVSIRTARRMGFREFVPEEKDRHVCTALDENGQCSLQLKGEEKPILCRSYWCGGKWWSPKGTRLVVPAGDVIINRKGGINEKRQAEQTG